MGIKKVFVDKDNSEMECFLNTNNEIFIQITMEAYPDHPSFIVLEKEDAEELIILLSEELNQNSN